MAQWYCSACFALQEVISHTTKSMISTHFRLTQISLSRALLFLMLYLMLVVKASTHNRCYLCFLISRFQKQISRHCVRNTYSMRVNLHLSLPGVQDLRVSMAQRPRIELNITAEKNINVMVPDNILLYA